MAEIPKGLDNGLIVNSLSDKIDIVVIKDGKEASSTKMAAGEASMLACWVLDAAKGCPNATQITEVSPDWPRVSPTTVRLESDLSPDSVLLVLAFGPTPLAVSLNKNHLREIGQTMLTLSADNKAS